MLLKTRNNVIGVAPADAVAKVNIDGIRTDGSYPLADASGGGVYPDGASFPTTLVVSNTGDTQTIGAEARNYGLDGWGDWV